jgi:hypothetical protein
MTRFISALVLFSALALPSAVPAAADDQAELARLLERFLAGASVNDADMHDRFWAEDLIYTASSGRRFGKAEIMGSLEEASGDAGPAYSAADVTIRVFGETAVVTFRLIAREADAVVGEYFNTGVFRKREGVWKAVTWQATRAGDGEAEN